MATGAIEHFAGGSPSLGRECASFRHLEGQSLDTVQLFRGVAARAGHNYSDLQEAIGDAEMVGLVIDGVDYLSFGPTQYYELPYSDSEALTVIAIARARDVISTPTTHFPILSNYYGVPLGDAGPSAADSGFSMRFTNTTCAVSAYRRAAGVTSGAGAASVATVGTDFSKWNLVLGGCDATRARVRNFTEGTAEVVTTFADPRLLGTPKLRWGASPFSHKGFGDIAFGVAVRRWSGASSVEAIVKSARAYAKRRPSIGGV